VKGEGGAEGGGGGGGRREGGVPRGQRAAGQRCQIRPLRKTMAFRLAKKKTMAADYSFKKKTMASDWSFKQKTMASN
jgi:hypothetical protein